VGTLRRAESDVLVYWGAVDDPVLAARPTIGYLDRVLLVARGHRLARRVRSQLTSWRVSGYPSGPPTFPGALMDAFVPLTTPSGQPTPRAEPVRSFHEMMSLVARGRMVHPTVTGVTLGRREDIVAVPLTGLPPIPLGLVWRTAHENARIRALADVAKRLHPPGMI
jgi:hypothetical protein